MPDTRYCSFCEASEHDVKKLIAKEPHYICDECVELCVDIIEAPKVERERRTFIGDYVLARARTVSHGAGLDGCLAANEAVKVWDQYLAPSKPTSKAQLKVAKS